MKKSPHHNHHAKVKAIRATNRQLEEGLAAPEPTAPPTMAATPPSPKTPHKKKHSKRTTPGEIKGRESEPAVFQQERPQWHRIHQQETHEANLQLHHKMEHWKKPR